jgi:hypothetical protein
MVHHCLYTDWKGIWRCAADFDWKAWLSGLYRGWIKLTRIESNRSELTRINPGMNQSIGVNSNFAAETILVHTTKVSISKLLLLLLLLFFFFFGGGGKKFWDRWGVRTVQRGSIKHVIVGRLLAKRFHRRRGKTLFGLGNPHRDLLLSETKIWKMVDSACSKISF